MKKLLKKLALLPLFCGLILTSACSNDDENGNDNNNDIPTGWFDGTITATVVDGNEYNDLISGVEAVGLTFVDGGDIETIATGTWANGGFTITLPATLDNRFLFRIGDEFESDPDLLDFTVSNMDAMATIFDGIAIRALDSDGNSLGSIWHYRENASSHIIYVDRDVIISGTFYYDGFSEVWNISFRRGWNKLYIVERETATGFEELRTTEYISGFRWYFWNLEDGIFRNCIVGFAPMATKSTTQSRSFFSRLGR